jgi:hypothetical protein
MMDRLQFMRDERQKACSRLSDDRLQDALDQFDHYLIGALSSSSLMHDEAWQRAVTVACQCVAEDFKPAASSQQPILTALQSFILLTIHRYGPQSDMSLWAHTRCESLKAVIVASAILAEENFIELTPTNKNPCRFPINSPVKYWQLTQKGQDHIAALGAASSSNAQQQEVCLGS